MGGVWSVRAGAVGGDGAVVGVVTGAAGSGGEVACNISCNGGVTSVAGSGRVAAGSGDSRSGGGAGCLAGVVGVVGRFGDKEAATLTVARQQLRRWRWQQRWRQVGPWQLAGEG